MPNPHGSRFENHQPATSAVAVASRNVKKQSRRELGPLRRDPQGTIPGARGEVSTPRQRDKSSRPQDASALGGLDVTTRRSRVEAGFGKPAVDAASVAPERDSLHPEESRFEIGVSAIARETHNRAFETLSSPRTWGGEESSNATTAEDGYLGAVPLNGRLMAVQEVIGMIPIIASLETVSLEEALAYLDTAEGDELAAAYALAKDRNIIDGSSKEPDDAEVHHALFLLRRARGLNAPSFDLMRVQLKRRVAA